MGEIAAIAVCRLLVAFQSMFERMDFGFKLPRRLIRLPLREGLVERLAGGFVGAGIQQIHGHIESRFETRMQRIHTFAGQRRGGGRNEPLMVDNHRVANRIDATTPRTARQLREFSGGEHDVPCAVVFLKFFDDDAAGRHVDTKRESLRGEYHFHQTLFEQTFDNLSKQGNHTCMMRGETFLQRETESRESQCFEIVAAHLPFNHLIDNLTDPHRLIVSRQFEPRIDALLDRLIAAIT